MRARDSRLFHEQIYTEKTDDSIADECEVYVDAKGHFVTVETDSYEGQAMMTLPLAEKVHEALGRAIAIAREARIAATTPKHPFA